MLDYVNFIRLNLHIMSHRIIVTSKIRFYFISCRKSIPKDAKLYVNETVLSETEIYKTKSPL